MKKISKKHLLILSTTLIVIATTLFISSCAKKTSYGQKIVAPTTNTTNTNTNTAQPKVKDILASDQYVGKEVVLQGKITLECGSGCWFNLDDGTGKLYVDLLPSNIAIPQWVGKTVVAKGKVIKEEGDIKMIGTGVTLK
jgi:hypothetical protein